MPSSFPILFYVWAFVMTYVVTEWAWLNPGYHMILMFPAYSLVNSQQIVCNVTKMNMSAIPVPFLLFLLFPLNRYILEFMPDLKSHS